MTLQNPTTEIKPTAPAIPCILAVGEPTGEAMTYRYSAIGHFDSKARAKRKLAEIQAANPEILYLILDGRPEKRAAVWDKFAAQLEPPQKHRPAGLNAMLCAVERAGR